MKKKKLPKIKTQSQLRKRADQIFSWYIRLRDRDNSGECVCYTCGRKSSYKKMQNGHFVPRQYLWSRYDEINCHAQCYACNMLYNGQPSAYAKKLNEEYGPDTVSILEMNRKNICPSYNYQAIIDIYSQKIIDMGFGDLL